LLLPM